MENVDVEGRVYFQQFEVYNSPSVFRNYLNV